jgi:hypothetical protein
VECGSPSRCTTTRANKGSERSQASDNKSESAVGEEAGRSEGGTESEGKRCLRCYRGAKPKRAVAVKEAETSSIYRRS